MLTVLVLGLAQPSSAQTTTPTPVGAWFGVARPCTPGDRFPVPPGTDDQSICSQACLGVCPPSNFPVDEVTMLPNILADGTVLADDFAELLDHHSTAQGRWTYAGSVTIDGKKMDQYQASFIWFDARSPQDVDPQNPLSIFLGVIRPRFVTFFDPTNPDVMRGYIQPYVYTMTDKTGIVQLQPGTPFPSADPVARLPVTCDPKALTNPYCAGTLHFVIRRLQPQ
jgi:hypothetical protein